MFFHVQSALLRVPPVGEAVLALPRAELMPEPPRHEALPAVVAGPRAEVVRRGAPVGAVVTDDVPSR